MAFDILITIAFLSLVQSIFGTGVLLFGTPILLILGYNFQYSLIILLPISVSINLLQIKDDFRKINIEFYKKLIFYCLPFIFLSLYLLNFTPAKINFYVGLFLVLIGLKNNIISIERFIGYFLRYESIYLILMGVLHGITNLGGALLSGAIFNKKLSKDSKRATIAICYLSMGIIQIITLIFKLNASEFLKNFNLSYWIVSLVIYFLTKNYLYYKINDERYIKFSDLFLLLMGITLTMKTYY